MNRLLAVALFFCILGSSCSNKMHSIVVEKSTNSFILNTTSTNIAAPTETLAPTITPQPTLAKQAPIPKILLLGDSLVVITKVPTYLSVLLKDLGISVQFVGDEYSFGNEVPADGLGGFDTGLMLKQLIEGTTWTRLNGTQFPNNFESQVPDIVVIQLGTNDAINAVEINQNPISTYRENMEQIIEFLRLRNPNVKIVVPMLIPSQWLRYNAKIELINSTISDFVEIMDKPNSRVVTTVDMKGVWEDSDFADNVHPSDSGSQKIAQAYFDALVNNHLVIVP